MREKCLLFSFLFFLCLLPQLSAQSTNCENAIKVFASWPNGNIEYNLTPTLYWYADRYPLGIKYQIRLYIDKNGNGLIDGDTEHLRKWPYTNQYIMTQGLTECFFKIPDGVLEPGRQYLWEVRAYDVTGLSSYDENAFSQWSNLAVFKTAAAPNSQPPVPSYPCGIEIYTTAPTLYWYYPGIVTGFNYVLEVYGPNGFKLAYTNITTFYYQVTGLIPGYTYTWRVRAAGGPYSPLFSFTVASCIAGKAVVSWPINSVEFTTRPWLYWYLQGSYENVQGYIVKYSTVNQTNWAGYNGNTDKSLGGKIVINNPYATYYNIEADLKSGTKYYWAVTAFGPGIHTNYSTGWFTVFGGSASCTPVLLYPFNGGFVYSNFVVFTWFVNGPLTNITGYEFKYIDAHCGCGSLDNQPSLFSLGITNFVQVNNLLPGHTYYWKVRSLPDHAWSEVFSFTVWTTCDCLIDPVPGSPADIELNSSSVVLSWRTPVTAASQKYDVQIANNPDFTNARLFTDLDQPNLEVSGLSANTYYWKVRASKNGTVTAFSDPAQFIINSVTDVIENEVPSSFSLEQNYPNPFNPATTIKYALPEAANVRLSIFNMIGQEIKVLVDQEMPAGTYSAEWYGDDNSGNKVSSGIYIYKFSAGSKIMSHKMIYIK